CFRCPFGKEPKSCAHECAQDLETVLRREGPDTVAAVILEGVVGANGVFVPPPGYWRKIRSICDRYGVLLIADEVLPGFGGTRRWSRARPRWGRTSAASSPRSPATAPTSPR